MSPIQWSVAICCILGVVFVLCVMLKHSLRPKFPFLFNYLALYLFSSCLTLGAFLYSCKVSSNVSCVLGSLLMVMELGVIHEVLANTLKSYSALADLAKLLFRWAAVFMFFTGFITALATNGQQATRLDAALDIVQHGVRLMQCGLLLFLLVFETRLGVSWRNHGVAVALGLGAYAAVDLTVSYLGNVPWLSTRILELVDGTAYAAVLLFWGSSLAMREPASKSLLDSPTRLIFQRWNEALMATPLAGRRGEVIAMSPVESFLPGVEKTVERVMARKMMH